MENSALQNKNGLPLWPWVSWVSLQGRISVYMPCEMTSTQSHRKTHSLSFPRETIPFLNYSISLPITAPSKHLHQFRSKCWQQLRDKVSLHLKVNICLLVYYCNATCYEKNDLLLHMLHFFQKHLLIFSERYWNRQPREGESETDWLIHFQSGISGKVAPVHWKITLRKMKCPVYALNNECVKI